MENKRRTLNGGLNFPALVVLLLGVTIFAVALREVRQDHLDNQLISAIRRNELASVRTMLAEGANPNSHAMKESASSFWRHFFTRFLRGTSDAGPLALTLAVQADNASIVGDLVSAGARDHGERLQPKNDGIENVPCTLVMYAAWNGNDTIIRTLIKNGSDVNAVDQSNRTALFYAKNASTVQALADCGAKINTTDKYGFSALDLSIRSGNFSVGHALINRGARDRKALSFAIEFDDMQGLRQMLDAGADLEQRDENGMTPLVNALFSPLCLSPEAALLLIKRGADVNFCSKGITPLLLASDGGRYPEMNEGSPVVLQVLLDSRANVNYRNKEGYTPLMVASEHLRPVLVQILLRYGAKVNVKSDDGTTALSLALFSPYKETHPRDASIVIHLLKQAGEKE